MGWLWFGKGKKEDADRRVAERRHEDDVPVSRLRKFGRFLLATLQSILWTLLWFLAFVGIVCVAGAVLYAIAPGVLEAVLLFISRALSDAIYAVDIRTGWFTNELPKMVDTGVVKYLMNLPVMLYVKFWSIVVAAFAVFVGATYVKRLRRFASIVAFMCFCGLLFGYYEMITPINDPPSYGAQLKDFRLKASSHVTDASGNVEIGCFAEENRIPVPLERVNPFFLNAIDASEDHAFEDHKGFNLYAIGRAAIANAIKAKIASGASTKTMQLTKNVFLTPERSVKRKIREVVIAVHLEHTVSKSRISYLYGNIVYLGGVYGWEAGAQSYFGKHASDVTIEEAAFLAALISEPELYRLGGNAGKKKIMERKDRVIKLMSDHGLITKQQKEEALKAPISPRAYAGTCKRTHEYINAAVNREFGIKGHVAIATAGRTYQTSIELDKQDKLEEACAKMLADYVKRHPENAETIQCSSVAVRIKDGEVVAMVGGQDFHRNQFDNAMQSERQAGSSFKPFLFVSLLEKRYNEEVALREQRCVGVSPEECALIKAQPMDLRSECKVLDAPVLVPNVVGWKGRVVNRHAIHNYPYEGRSQYRGMISCELALGESRNTATIWGEGQLAPLGLDELERWNTGADMVANMAHRLGVESVLQHRNVSGNTDAERATFLHNYTLPIGSAEVTVWEQADAFLSMVNGGCRQEITFIKKVTDSEGKVLYEHKPSVACKRVLAPQVAYEIRELLRAPIDVRGPRNVGGKDGVLLGTASSLRTTFPRGALCGKTGTSTGEDGSSSTENWFIGCTTEYLVATRMNNTNKTPLGKKETGGRNPIEVFRKFVLDLGLMNPDADFAPIDTSVVWLPPAPVASLILPVASAPTSGASAPASR